MAAPGEYGPLRVWLLPLSLLLGTAAAVFLFTCWVDGTHAGDAWQAVRLFYDPNPVAAASTLSNAGEIVAAVLAIAITVVAIVVELAANRYTHRITELFVSAPVNFVVMGFFVVTALQSLWVTLTFDYDAGAGTGFVPMVGVRVSMGMLTLSLLILLPYFGFVFAFLNPVHIVHRIQSQTLALIRSRKPSLTVEHKQREAVRGIEQVADVGLNAMENKDKGVSMASVDALSALVLDYQALRPHMRERWFRVEGSLAHNADFVSMSEDVLAEVSNKRIWFEMKVLRQFQTIYGEALNRMRDINYIIAINTRRIAEAAIRAENRTLLDLALKFFNTYLRATINARDIRTAYNVLHQYRLVAERLLDHERGAGAVEVARYFKYYGLAAYAGALPFVLETVAYDMCALNEMAFNKKSPVVPELLRIFLEVDRESETEVQEQSLRGVRKAQVKLATYYLLEGDDKLARKVFEDMKREDPVRMASIRDELLGVRSRDFWEISDRGVNFDYLSPERKEKLMEFFAWFGDLIPPRASRVPPRSSDMPMPADAAPPDLSDSSDSIHAVPGVGKAGDLEN